MRSFIPSLVMTLAVSGVVGTVSGCVVHEDRNPPPAPAAPAPPIAAQGGAHPAYLHALSDLRNARFNLERKGGDPAMKWDEHDGIMEVDRSIDEIKKASIDDGKNLNDHPPVDAREPRVGRLHKALDALRAARNDVSQEEDNGFAGGLKARSIEHIDAAIRHTEQGIQEAERGI
jgi:hypothetical protein